MSISPTTLRTFSFGKPPTSQLPRDKTIQTSYDIHMSNSAACQKFKKDIKLTLVSKPIFVQENDFPYKVDEGITHYLVWTTDVSNAIVEIPQMFSNNLITFWKNLPSNCSIPEIDHIHVFAYN
jgi:hypothetical protein